MGWRRAAIVGCAMVAVLAGATSVVAAAISADHAPGALTPSPNDSPETRGATSSTHRSSVTIILDGPTEACLSRLGTPDASQQTAASCGALVLPIGATEEDVLRRLGEPHERRPLREGSEAWTYSAYLDQQHYGFASVSLTFRGRRLVDGEEYIFK